MKSTVRQRVKFLAENIGPELTGDDKIVASIGEMVTLKYSATDEDGDAVTIEALEQPDDATFTSNKLIWTVNNTDPVAIRQASFPLCHFFQCTKGNKYDKVEYTVED